MSSVTHVFPIDWDLLLHAACVNGGRGKCGWWVADAFARRGALKTGTG